jgi:hypothetical protein
MKVKFTVEQRHIDEWYAVNEEKILCNPCTNCAVALALKDAGIQNPFVGAIYISFKDDRTDSVQVPPDLRDFIEQVDMGRVGAGEGVVVPRTFEVEIND